MGRSTPPYLRRPPNRLPGRSTPCGFGLGSLIGEPWQFVDPVNALTVTFLDMTAEPGPEDAAVAWMERDASEPVDLLRDRLAVWTLFKVATDRYLWCYRYHHLVIDGFSLSLIAQRMADVYSSLAQDLALDQSSLAPLRVLIEEDAAYRASQQFEDDRDYWVGQFVGRPGGSEIAQRTPQRSGGVLRERTHVAPSRIDELRLVAQRAGLTWPRLMIVATAIHLHRVTGLETVVVGVPVAGRTNALTRRVAGMATNLVHVCLTVRADSSLKETLQDATSPIREALQRQRYRHEDLVRDLRLFGVDALLRGPTINVRLFDYNIRFAGHPITVESVARAPVDDLTIGVYDRRDQGDVRVDFEANPGLYSPEDLQMHQRGFLGVLDALVADAHQAIGQIDVPLSTMREPPPPDGDPRSDPIPEKTALGSSRAQSPLEAEASFVTVAGADQRASRPHNPFCEFQQEDIETSISRRFEAQVALYPDNDAVVTAQHRWTYRMLDVVVQRIARIVKVTGRSTTEPLVGLLFGSGAPMVAAMLGTMTAGRAYVPLDPTMPPERLSTLMRNAGIRVVLTESEMVSIAERLQVAGQLEVVNTDLMRIDHDGSGAQDHGAPRPDDLAYVLYTSGSTGEPKGVMQNHRNVLHFIRSYTNGLHLSAGDRVALFASYAFDAAVMDVYGAVLNGATLYPFDVPNQGVQGVSQWIAANKISVLHLTPTLFRAFVATVRQAGDLDSVRMEVSEANRRFRSDLELFKRYFSEAEHPGERSGAD